MRQRNGIHTVGTLPPPASLQLPSREKDPPNSMDSLRIEMCICHPHGSVSGGRPALPSRSNPISFSEMSSLNCPTDGLIVCVPCGTPPHPPLDACMHPTMPGGGWRCLQQEEAYP